MAKTSKKPAESKALAPAPAAAPKRLDITLAHSEHHKAAIAFAGRASKIVIADKASHEGALREAQDGKKIKRAIAGYWKRIKQRIDAVKRAVLDLEKAEDAAVDAGLVPLENTIVNWTNREKARVAAELETQRIANEAKAKADRERELKAQEDAAEELEANSPNLSPGELWFVTKVVEQEINWTSSAAVDIAAMGVILAQAGYKNPRRTLERMWTSEKIGEAIAAKRQAAMIREQAAALREQPVHVATPVVESKIAKVAGVRMVKTWTLDRVVDLDAFIAAYRRGDLPDEAMIPNEVHLRRFAKDLEDKFEQAYPGCKAKFTEGVAG